LIDGVEPGVIDRLDPRRFKSRPAELAPLAPKRTDFTREVDRFRSGFLRERDQLPFGPAVADDETRSTLAKRLVELGEALQEKLRPRARLMPPVEQSVVETEDGHDTLMAVESREQRGMVAHPKVATKPNDAGPASGHGPNLPRRLGVQARNEGHAVCGRVEHVRAKQLARPCAVPAPAAMKEGGCGHGRPARERQLALRADEGPVGDHLAAIGQELSLELGRVGAESARDGAIVTLIAEVGLEERHRLRW